MSTERNRLISSAVGNLALLVVLVGVGAIYTATGGSARELLVTDLFVNMILVVGLQIFIGNTGVLSFGHLSFATIGGYGMALLAIPATTKALTISDAPFGLSGVQVGITVATLIGIGVALVVSLAIGAVVARAPGLAATMITLAQLFVFEQIAKVWTDLTNGGGRLSGVPGFEGNGWPIAGAAIAIVVAVTFRSSRSGRLAVATREDELAAGAMGINVMSPRFVAYVVSAAVVAFGGILQVRAVGSIGPEQFNFDVTILILAMLVVGGMNTVTGAIVGATFITIGKEVARQVGDGAFGLPRFEGLPDLFLAGSLLFVLVVVKRPNGITGDFDAGRLAARFLPTRQPNATPILPDQRHVTDASAAADVTAQAPVAVPATAALVATNLGVVFGGFTALEGVDLSVDAGQIRGLIGPNGAGKTTLVNLLTGVVQSTTGDISLGGAPVSGKPYRRARQGISRTFQNLRVFGNLTVRDNVDTAHLIALRYRANVPGPSVDVLLELSGLTELADRQASTLDYGNQRRLEIARAAALRPDFMLLDEPTSGMSETESMVMVDHIRTLAGAIGAGVLVIDHDLGFINALSERITVLDQGRLLAEGTPSQVLANPAVIDAYLGTQA